MSALRNAKWDADAALILLARYKNWLMVVFVAQILVAFFSYTLWEGVVNAELVALYMLMWAVPVALAHFNENKLDTIKPGKPVSWLSRVRYYMLFGIGAAALFYMMQNAGIIRGGTLFAPYALGTFIYQIVVVSPSESIFFQGVVPSILKREFTKRQCPNCSREVQKAQSSHFTNSFFCKPCNEYVKPRANLFEGHEIILSFAISQGLFALAHYAAYSQHTETSQLLFQSFLFGCAFLWLAWYSGYGLSAAFGVHSAWNWVLISGGGITTLNISFTGGLLVIIGFLAIFVCLKFRKQLGQKLTFIKLSKKSKSTKGGTSC